jgi:hypothetical protein
MATYEQPILAGFEDASLCSVQAFPASQLPWPGSEEARMMTVGSGRQCSKWLDVSSPLGVFSRILLESLLWTSSEEYCYVWERLDTRFAYSAFQLTPLGQSTEGNGYSLWPTPTAMANTGGQAMCKWGGAGAREQLRKMVTPEELNGLLNPQWVEWLMGYPIDHTALKR